VSQRTKEGASDYRYFPEPDLPPLSISPEWVSEIGASLPELPHARKARFMDEIGLPEYNARLLTASRETADYFEAALDSKPNVTPDFARAVSNWIIGEIGRLSNQTGIGMSDIRVKPDQVTTLQKMVDEGALSSTMAKTVFEKMFETGRSADDIARSEGLTQISDTDAVSAAVEQAIADNPDPVRDYLGGKQQAMGFLVGQVMKATRGQANPRMASQLVREKLEAMR
jgi:aspartyl-tRNA(Asn)/glutamyl-tRNA(Gln) amidotransferase subunit B